MPVPSVAEPLPHPTIIEPIEAFVPKAILKAHRDKSLPVPIAHYESKPLFNPPKKTLQPLMGAIQYYPVPIEHYQDLDLSQYLRHNQSDY